MQTQLTVTIVRRDDKSSPWYSIGQKYEVELSKAFDDTFNVTSGTYRGLSIPARDCRIG